MLILTIITRLKSIRKPAQAVFFALFGLRHAHLSMRSFIVVDSTRTSSRFQMTLLIASSIDTNGKTLPLARALVLIECNSVGHQI